MSAVLTHSVLLVSFSTNFSTLFSLQSKTRHFFPSLGRWIVSGCRHVELLLFIFLYVNFLQHPKFFGTNSSHPRTLHKKRTSSMNLIKRRHNLYSVGCAAFFRISISLIHLDIYPAIYLIRIVLILCSCSGLSARLVLVVAISSRVSKPLVN